MKQRYEKFTVVMTFLCIGLLIAGVQTANEYENLIAIKDKQIIDYQDDVEDLKKEITSLKIENEELKNK